MYGRKGSENGDCVPLRPNAKVEYLFKVEQIISLHEQINMVDLADAKKKIGNDSFKYDLDGGEKARRSWMKGLELLEESGEHNNIGMDMWNNIALLEFKKKCYSEAKNACMKAINDYDKNNFKAWLRLGWIFLMAGEYKQVEETIERINTIEKDKRKFKALIVEYRKRKNAYKRKEKDMSMKMIQKEVKRKDIIKPVKIMKTSHDKEIDGGFTAARQLPQVGNMLVFSAVSLCIATIVLSLLPVLHN